MCKTFLPLTLRTLGPQSAYMNPAAGTYPRAAAWCITQKAHIPSDLSAAKVLAMPLQLRGCARRTCPKDDDIVFRGDFIHDFKGR
jgi:hypothetical protein